MSILGIVTRGTTAGICESLLCSVYISGQPLTYRATFEDNLTEKIKVLARYPNNETGLITSWQYIGLTFSWSCLYVALAIFISLSSKSHLCKTHFAFFKDGV